MVRSFVRVLWGSEDEDEIVSSFSKMKIELNDDQISYLSKRRWKSGQDIQKQLKWKYPLKSFVTYVYGESNKKILDDLGLENVLLNKSPYVLRYKQSYCHKLYAFETMMKDFDEIVFLDWDTKLIKELPDDFWEKLNEKEAFQASLWRYKTPKIKHRKGKANKFCPAGGFVYMRDKTIPKRLIELWKTGPNSWSEEPSFALLTDEMSGGWGGIVKYRELFEPECYKCRKSPYSDKEACFLNIGKPWSF
jgi:hypothetical protein